MRNNKFWDECSVGGIREIVARFIDASPLLSKFKNEKYYQLEDSIVGLIEDNKELIFNEVLAEHHREDIQVEIESRDNASLLHILNALPHHALVSVVDEWQDTLNDDEVYCDARNEHLRNAIGALGVFDNIENYNEKQVELYAVYLIDWYEQHKNDKQVPVCIDEFFTCEMQDEELAEHYELLAQNYKIKDGKFLVFKCPKCDSKNIVLSNGGSKDFYFCDDCNEDSSIEEVEEYAILKKSSKGSKSKSNLI